MNQHNAISQTPAPADFHASIARGGDAWFRACLRITGDDSSASDAVQDALLRAWHRRRQFNGQSRLDTWIHRIAVNSALELLRSRHPERWAVLDVEPPDDSRRPDIELERSNLVVQFDASLASLSHLERMCVVLKHVEQWRLQEIADELDASVGTVKQALFRGIRKIRGELGDLRRTP